MICLISLFGGIRALHLKQYKESLLYLAIFAFVYTGTTSVLDGIAESGTQHEHALIEKEEYIKQWVFAESSVAVERADSSTSKGDVFHVMLEQNAHIYEVTIYEDEAFGLYRYAVASFNSDERLSIEETP